MGHAVDRTSYRIRFEDGPLAGAEVEARSVTTGEYMRLKGMAASAETSQEEHDHNQALFEAFAGALVSWDLEDAGTGKPIPADLTGLWTLDLGVSLQLSLRWLETVASAPRPLSNGSTGGETETRRELALPMSAHGS